MTAWSRTRGLASVKPSTNGRAGKLAASLRRSAAPAGKFSEAAGTLTKLRRVSIDAAALQLSSVKIAATRAASEPSCAPVPRAHGQQTLWGHAARSALSGQTQDLTRRREIGDELVVGRKLEVRKRGTDHPVFGQSDYKANVRTGVGIRSTPPRRNVNP